MATVLTRSAKPERGICSHCEGGWSRRNIPKNTLVVHTQNQSPFAVSTRQAHTTLDILIRAAAEQKQWYSWPGQSVAGRSSSRPFWHPLWREDAPPPKKKKTTRTHRLKGASPCALSGFSSRRKRWRGEKLGGTTRRRRASRSVIRKNIITFGSVSPLNQEDCLVQLYRGEVSGGDKTTRFDDRQRNRDRKGYIR